MNIIHIRLTNIIQLCKIFSSWFYSLKTAGLQSAFTKFGSFKIEWPGKDGKLKKFPSTKSVLVK